MPANYEEADKIIEATDIVALVSKYVKLEKQGKNYKGLCPFHNEKTGSFIVSPDKRLAHCFGCGGGGNPINFLMQIENIEFPEALAKLAEFNGMELSRYQKPKQVNKNDKYYKIMQVSADFYRKYIDNTKEGLAAKEYLKKRGMSDEIMKAFGVGLSPKIGDTLYQVLKEYDFLELDMADVSLVDKGVTGYHDIFAERIMFPISDEQGRIVAFSARIFNNLDKKQPKYINSRESVIFHKGETLFNLNLAKPDILKMKRVILHEGQMDVIASYRSSLKETVCTLGTALSDSHIQTLKKYTKSAVICYDGDKAGINASKKAIALFKNNGFSVHLVLLPNGMDPDEYVLKYGEEAYKDYFENHQMDSNQYLFEVAFLNRNLEDSNVLEELKGDVFSLIQSMQSKTEQEDYLKRFAGKINASLEAVAQDYEVYRRNHASSNASDLYPYPQEYYVPEDYYFKEEEEIKEPKPIHRYKSICELRLFMYAKASREKALQIDSMIGNMMQALSVDSQNLWIKLINDYYENYQTFEEGHFMKMLSQEQASYYIEIIEALRGDITKYSDEDMLLCIEKLKEIKCDVDNETLSKQITRSNDVTEISRLIDQKIKNKKQKNQLTKNRRR